MNSDYKKVFAKNLNNLLARNKKTQADLVADLKLNKSTVSTWANGTKMPRMNKIEQLANYFGVEKSDLIEDKSDTNEQYYNDPSVSEYAQAVKDNPDLRLLFDASKDMSKDDIDLDNAIIDVNKQFAYSGESTYMIRNLKTKNSYRKIPIPPILIDILLEYKNTTSGLYLFNNPTGGTGAVSVMIKRYLPNTSIHDLRHTYATRLLANGVDIKTVASLLGDTVDTVINTYIHYTDEMRLKAHDSVSKIFG